MDWGRERPDGNIVKGHSDNGGSAARFFYSAKASRSDRAGSKHPTVKPITLMQWLARLITPPGGTILDPFAGSGTTGMAAQRKGFACIMCEREDEYIDDIKRRFTAVQPCSQETRPNQTDLFDGQAADA
jgi:site-specific DNA-methyltransferase (adenine-specific)